MATKKQFTFVFEDLTEPYVKAANAIWMLNFELPARRIIRESLISLPFVIAVGFVYLLGVACLNGLSFNVTWLVQVLLIIVAFASQILYVVIYVRSITLSEPDMDTARTCQYWSVSPQLRRFIIARCKETGDVAGTIAVKRTSPNDSTAELVRLRVDDRFYGYGLGRRLSQQCVDIAREWNCRQVFLSTIKDHSFGIKLYEDFGFQFVKELTMFRIYGVTPINCLDYIYRLEQEEEESKL